jgi:hypothetical protein
MGPIRCPETSVNNYRTTPRNNPEDRRYYQHRGEAWNQCKTKESASIPRLNLFLISSRMKFWFVRVVVPKYLNSPHNTKIYDKMEFKVTIWQLPKVGWAGIAQSVYRLATSWTVRGSNPGGGEIFRTRPDRPWGPPSLLYNGYRVSFPGVKRSRRGVNHPPSSSAEVKERVELYLYSPSGPSWPRFRENCTLPKVASKHNVQF